MIPDKNLHGVRSGPNCLKAAGIGVIAGLLSAIVGCGTYLPSSGPSGARIKANAEKSYDLIPITNDVVRTIRNKGSEKRRNSLNTLAAATQESRARDSRLFFRFSVPGSSTMRASATGINRLPAPARKTISAGDVLNITIYETGGALFGTLNSTTGIATSNIQMPSQVVEESGEITVPYAGLVPVIGITPHEVEAEIARRLKGKAIDPQVIVTLGERNGGNFVTVTGDVKSPKLFPLGVAPARLLDALTDAGGSTGRAHETVVSVLRGSVVRSDSLAEIIEDPAKNVTIQTGDTITVKNRPRSYLAFGATGSNRRFAFDADQLTLAEAMAQSGGPLDNRANPSAIFVHRLEPIPLVRKLGYQPCSVIGDAARVIYQLDLVSPSGFFLAQSFEVQDKDIIYYSPAGSVGLGKFLNLLNTVTSGARAEIQTAGGL